MNYLNENEINEMITRFETGTIAESDWRHAEHVLVACRYATDHDLTTAIDRMRSGIVGLLAAFGVKKDDKYPYHETLTVFWIRYVTAARKLNGDLGFFEFCRLAEAKFKKDLPLRFYSRELLFSAAAREKFVEPDLRPIEIL